MASENESGKSKDELADEFVERVKAQAKEYGFDALVIGVDSGESVHAAAQGHVPYMLHVLKMAEIGLTDRIRNSSTSSLPRSNKFFLN